MEIDWNDARQHQQQQQNDDEEEERKESTISVDLYFTFIPLSLGSLVLPSLLVRHRPSSASLGVGGGVGVEGRISTNSNNGEGGGLSSTHVDACIPSSAHPDLIPTTHHHPLDLGLMRQEARKENERWVAVAGPVGSGGSHRRCIVIGNRHTVLHPFSSHHSDMDSSSSSSSLSSNLNLSLPRQQLSGELTVFQLQDVEL